MSPTSSNIRRDRLPAPFKASAQPELNRLEQAAADFVAAVAKRDQKGDAELGEHLFTVAGVMSEAVEHCMTSFKVRYACLYRRVLLEDAATLRAETEVDRLSRDEPLSPQMQEYFELLNQRFLDHKHSDEDEEAMKGGGGFLVRSLQLFQQLSQPQAWPGTESHNTAETWTLCAGVACHMYRSARPKLERLFELMSRVLEKERVTLAECGNFGSIVTVRVEPVSGAPRDSLGRLSGLAKLRICPRCRSINAPSDANHGICLNCIYASYIVVVVDPEPQTANTAAETGADFSPEA